MRELLSRHFDTARQVIGRYGGTVEKFIGDAVMAVLGALVANEDDAERAGVLTRARRRPEALASMTLPPATSRRDRKSVPVGGSLGS